MDRTLFALIAALALALLVFAVWPGLDLATSHLVYDRGGFWGESGLAQGFRNFFRIGPYVLLIALGAAWALKRFGLPIAAPSPRAVLFLVAALSIGPGLIVNLAMKDHLHRPRPLHVQEFGGDAPFKRWYEFDGACNKNCGFASGEASEGFWLVAPALLAPPPWRGAAIVGAIVFGTAMSALRLAFGGHFLSDLIVGALISLIVIFGLRRVFWRDGGP